MFDQQLSWMTFLQVTGWFSGFVDLFWSKSWHVTAKHFNCNCCFINIEATPASVIWSSDNLSTSPSAHQAQPFLCYKNLKQTAVSQEVGKLITATEMLADVVLGHFVDLVSQTGTAHME